MRTYLEIGSKAPDFEGKDQNGNSIKLSDYLGKKVVLYFYSKDDTPGCTKEACNLRDNHQTLIDAGYVVLGVSADDSESHTKFIEKYELPFSLIADTDKKIITDYHIWGEKSLFGKKSMGIFRTTYVINEEGKILHILKKVKTDDHANQILQLKEKTKS